MMKNLATASASPSPLLLLSRALLLLWMPDVLRLLSLAVSEALAQPVADTNNSNITNVPKLLSQLSPATATPRPSSSPPITDVTAPDKPGRRPQKTNAGALPLPSPPPAANAAPVLPYVSVVLGEAETKSKPSRKPPGAVWLPQQPSAVDVLAQRQNQLLGNRRHAAGNDEKRQTAVSAVAPLRTLVSVAFPTSIAGAGAGNAALVAQPLPYYSEGLYTPGAAGRGVADHATVRAAADGAAASVGHGDAAAARKKLPQPLPSSVARADITEIGAHSPLTYLSSPLSVQRQETETKQHARQQHLPHHDKHKQSRVAYSWSQSPPATATRATSAAVQHCPTSKGPKYEKIQGPHAPCSSPLRDLLYRPPEQRRGDYGVREQSEAQLHGKNQLPPALSDLLMEANQKAGSSSIETGRSAVSKNGRLQLPSLPAVFVDLPDILGKHKLPTPAGEKASAAAAGTRQAAGAASKTGDQEPLTEPWSAKKGRAFSLALPPLNSVLPQARVEATAAKPPKEPEAGALANAAEAGKPAGAAEAERPLREKDERGPARAAGGEGAASIEVSARGTKVAIPQTAFPVQNGGQLPLGRNQQAAVGAEARYAPESRAAPGGGGAAARLEPGGQVLSETPRGSRGVEPVAAPSREAPLTLFMPSGAAHLAWIIQQMKSRPPFSQANAAHQPQEKHPRGEAEGQKVIQGEQPLQLPEQEPRKVGGFPSLNAEEKYPHRGGKVDENAWRQGVDDLLWLKENNAKRAALYQNEAEDKILLRTELPDVAAAIAEYATAVGSAVHAGGPSPFAPIFVEQSQIAEQQLQRQLRPPAGKFQETTQNLPPLVGLGSLNPVWEAGTSSVSGSGEPGEAEGEQSTSTALGSKAPGTGFTDASTVPSHSVMKVDRALPPAPGREEHGKRQKKRKVAKKKKLKEANKRAEEKEKKKKAKSAKRRRAGQKHKIAGKHARAASAYSKPAANARPADGQQNETAAAPEPPAAAAAEARAPVSENAGAGSAAAPLQQSGFPSQEHAFTAPQLPATRHVDLIGGSPSATPMSSVQVFSPLGTDVRYSDGKPRAPGSGGRTSLAEVQYTERPSPSPEEKTSPAPDRSEAPTTAETEKRPEVTRHRGFLDGQFLVSTERRKLRNDLGLRKRTERSDILHTAWKALKAVAATTSSSGRLLYLRLRIIFEGAAVSAWRAVYAAGKLPWSWDRFVRELPPVDDNAVPEFRSIRRQLGERRSEVLIISSPSPALRHLVHTERPEAVFSHGLVIKARVLDARRTAKSASEINGLLKIVPRSPFMLSAYAAWVSRPRVSSSREVRYETKQRGKAAEGEGGNKANDWQGAVKKGKKKEKHLPRSVLYVVTPRARGDLDDYIHEGRFPIDVELTAAEMLYALYLLHDSGFIHRDIKLMNYFVTYDGHVVLGDFDGVWPIGIPVSTKDHLLYTKGYLAPEVDINKKFADYSEKSDIYALGICFKELHEAKPRMRNVEGFKNLYRRMIAMNPEKRPTALQAMQHDFFKNVNFSTLELLKHPPPLPGTFAVNAGFYG